MAAPCTITALPPAIRQLLQEAFVAENSYISLRYFLKVLFSSMYIQTDERLDLDFKMYDVNLVIRTPELQKLSLQDLVQVEGFVIEKSLHTLFERAHYAGLIRDQGDDARSDNQIQHWSRIEQTTLLKGLCWVAEARELLLSISFEFTKVDKIFREQCYAFKRLNNAEVLFGNAKIFMHYLTDNQWVQLAAYCKVRGIDPETTRAFLKGDFRTSHGLLSIEQELTVNTHLNPQEALAFIEVFSLKDDEVQAHLSF